MKAHHLDTSFPDADLTPPAPIDAAVLDERLREAAPLDILRAALDTFPGRIAAVSSFGTESAVLLHMIAAVGCRVPCGPSRRD